MYWVWKIERKMSISFKYFGIRWQGKAFSVLLFHLPSIRTVEQNWELALSRQRLFPMPSASFVTNWETARVLASFLGKSKEDTLEILRTCPGLLAASGGLQGAHSATFSGLHQHLIRVLIPISSGMKARGGKERSRVSRQKGNFYVQSWHYTYNSP